MSPLFLSFLIQAELFKTNLEILILFLFAIFIAIAHQLLCHHNIILSNPKSFINSSTIVAYSSKSCTLFSLVFQNQGRSGMITLYHLLNSISHTDNQL
ncbi:hypothetical protein HOF65_05445 [bacterium]|nr:hypothetical protein [bacterium]MBT3853388.1 hypothetical protein [bacterium]MBT4633131.1 hypothetical protein [bacterium]MBT6778928.1 hypothetical protein [bacterium]